MSQSLTTNRPVQDLLAPKRTPLGLLTGTRGSPLLFSEVAARLRSLAAAPETKAAKAEIVAVLGCRWSGLRVLAIQTLGAWGGAANKAWLVQRILHGPQPREPGWSLTELEAAMHCVAAMLDGSDAIWVLTLAREDSNAWRVFHSYVDGVPDEVFLAWLPGALRESHGLARVRLTHMVGRRTTLPGYMELMQRLAGDEGEMVAKAARTWIAKTGL